MIRSVIANPPRSLRCILPPHPIALSLREFLIQTSQVVGESMAACGELDGGRRRVDKEGMDDTVPLESMHAMTSKTM